MMRSYWFGKIKRSITNPVQSSVPKPQDKPEDSFFLPDFSNNKALVELLITSNVMAFVMSLLSEPQLSDLSWSHVMKYIFMMNWISVSFAWLSDHWRIRLQALPRVQAVIVTVLMMEAVVMLVTLAANLGMKWLMHQQIGWWYHVSYNLLLGGCVGGLVMRYLYVREQRMQRHRAELLSRVQALQARIRPHFLFNTMNSVIGLIQLDPVRAEHVVENLARLFRASLNATGEVCLLDEVNLCQDYLNIEKIRLGDRLQIEWHLPDEDQLYEANIPSLTLQPLLENAIYHGVEPRVEPSTISVLIQVDEFVVTIVMTNPCQTGKTNTRIGNSMALDNIQERLKAYYGRKARLQTHQSDGLFTTYLSYPYVAQ